jgi:hypothetical protein
MLAMSVISEHRIKRLLDREDIEGLLAIGAPGDEYESEAEMICSGIVKLRREHPNDLTTEGITEVITNVWQEMFGPMASDQLRAREPVFRKIAAEIYATTYP